MNYRIISSLLLMIIVLIMTACGTSEDNNHDTQVKNSVTKGQSLFSANCARCHGQGGIGTNQGPPLVHKIYESNHHGNLAFYRAVKNGVRSHHWPYGDMPPIKALKKAEISQIVSYIRREQHQAGIY